MADTIMREDPESLVLCDIDGGVASLVLNRPDRQNGWTPALGRRYFSLLGELGQNEDVRVIVVSGAGGSFCRGADVGVLDDLAEEKSYEASPERPDYWLALTIGKPVIGAISGACFGIGLQQALCLDFRFASESARFSTAYVRRGLVAEMGMSWLLPRIVGLGNAAELMFSGRTARPDEAQRIGLVNRVLSDETLLDETLGFARMMASSCSPRAMREMKGQLYRDLTTRFMPAFDRSEELLSEAFGWPDLAESMKSWKEKRAPEFPPLPAGMPALDINLLPEPNG
jgi:enoyl-CoA hydratase/carnithine racemase